MLPDMKITLTFTFAQLEAIEQGISAELRELSRRPRTEAVKKEESSLWDMRKQIDQALEQKAEAFKAYDEEYQRRTGDNGPMSVNYH